MTISSILVTLVAPMENHAANRGEKLLGNASSIKQRQDGRVYISGQMQRHVLFRAIDRLNERDPQRGDTYVSNGDGVPADIAKDIRSDLGGYLITETGEYSGRRTAPVTATPAVALEESKTVRDLLIRLRVNPDKGSEKKQALATNEFSQRDEMIMNFHLDVGEVGGIRLPKYEKEVHLSTKFEKLIDDAEHQRRIALFLEATRTMNDYANQARNAVSGEPNRVLIVLDTKLSRKAIRYFASETSEQEKIAILKELELRGASYFLGDDTMDEDLSVAEAYDKAFMALSQTTLFRPL